MAEQDLYYASLMHGYSSVDRTINPGTIEGGFNVGVQAGRIMRVGVGHCRAAGATLQNGRSNHCPHRLGDEQHPLPSLLGHARLILQRQDTSVARSSRTRPSPKMGSPWRAEARSFASRGLPRFALFACEGCSVVVPARRGKRRCLRKRRRELLGVRPFGGPAVSALRRRCSRRSGGDPWLCVPPLPEVCPCRGRRPTISLWRQGRGRILPKVREGGGRTPEQGEVPGKGTGRGAGRG